MPIIKLTPEQAWCAHIRAAAKTPKWVEDSKDISPEIPLSKRELLGLILLAHVRNYENNGAQWYVGYEAEASEPNDGFISDGSTKLQVEHKVVPQMSPMSPLDGILATYDKYSKKGAAYGENRVLLIHVNKSDKGLIKISTLRDQIQERGGCPFEGVFLIGCVRAGANPIFHLTEHFPEQGLAQVDLSEATGEATVPYCKITF